MPYSPADLHQKCKSYLPRVAYRSPAGPVAATLGTMEHPDRQQLLRFVMVLIVAILCLISTICGPLGIGLLLFRASLPMTL